MKKSCPLPAEGSRPSFFIVRGLGVFQCLGLPPGTWVILCRNLFSCCRLQCRWSVGADCSLKERFTEGFGELNTKLLIRTALMKELASQVSLCPRVEVLIRGLQAPHALLFPFPLSKHRHLQVLCCGSFWSVSYLSWLRFPAFQSKQNRVTLLCALLPFVYCFQLL